MAQAAYGGTGDVVDSQSTELNRLLRCMPSAEYQRLLPLLTTVLLTPRQSLYEPNEPIAHVYFPETGILSIIAEEQEGGAVEVVAVGNEGLLGVPVLQGAESMPFRPMVQIPGGAKRMPADAFREALAERPALRSFLGRYPLFLLRHLAQSVACARLHSLRERCARWLLTARDRLQSDTFPLTQDFLAEMLAVRRAGVSVAAEMLQDAGLIRYSRGRITILDRAGLEEAACSCYRLTRAAYERLFPEEGTCPPGV